MIRMPHFPSALRLALAVIGLSLALVGCGGGGGGSSPSVSRDLPASLTDPVAGHLARINEVRTAMGMNALAWNGPLQTAAAHHAGFLSANGVFGHAEWLGAAAFYAAGIGDRAALAGYQGALVGEAVVGGSAATQTDGRNLMDVALVSPGHRSVLLAPEFKDVGIAGSPLVTELGAQQSNWVAPDALFTYPYPQQTGLPTVFSPQDEEPNPLPGVAETGLPLSVHTRMFSSFVVRTASLRDSLSGAPVELLPNSDLGQSRSAFVFYPRLRLNPLRAYVFVLDCEIAGTTRHLEAPFSTGSF